MGRITRCHSKSNNWKQINKICQISRIYHGTKLVPSINHYNIEDPENPFKAFVAAEKPKPFKHED